MPAVPVSLESVWAQFAALLPEYPALAPAHPLGCHRRRIPDRVVFEHVVAAVGRGSGNERIAIAACSDRTIGLDLDDVAVDGCSTKAPGSGERAGRSPVDRGTRRG